MKYVKWSIFVMMILIDCVLFTNCILYLVGNYGVFHSINIVDLNYYYGENSELTGNQFASLNKFITGESLTALVAKATASDGSVTLSNFSLPGNKKLLNPQDYNVHLIKIDINESSGRSTIIAMAMGGGCFVIGPLLAILAYKWAEREH